MRVGELTVEARAARQDAAAARHIADLAVKVDANRQAINVLAVQTREQFGAVDRRFDAVDRRIDALERKVDDGFTEMRGKFDVTAAGLDQITGLLTTLISRENDRPS
ncbi:hypothetical protein HFP15_04320 [Amycolatopsis sp. K13G38]|uniref:Uncharacterized protein n=1 Tax=Amycolatopsis acididurans TaxID=2724524 RepID=A0ABX1J1G1_9PSEU|nr:hypothetical protein [Amycolatopsis acididurans]NKQ52102.1 hypothetical protein [Amycolatopsis acididurans]